VPLNWRDQILSGGFRVAPKIPPKKKTITSKEDYLNIPIPLLVDSAGYIKSVLSQAEYAKLEDDTFSGRVPECKGVIAFGDSLRECESELQSILKIGFSLVWNWATDFQW
jgi:hypothetical protein